MMVPYVTFTFEFNKHEKNKNVVRTLSSFVPNTFRLFLLILLVN